jgi:6,7-dimethyl-8-ribityllumazine synthase|tara:strand:+ start:316 stop:717 length:402 start_codon:yes stop_codon:yes gene_type:complete
MKKNILIVTANYYKDISSTMTNDVKKIISKNAEFNIQFFTVPGVFEIPVVIARNIKKYHGFIALGCVIKGETPHFEYISKSSIDALMNLSITHKKPIGNGIITCLNMDQAIHRSKKKGVEVINAVRSIFINDK